MYCPKKPDWGVGHILAEDGGARVTVFFLHGGIRTVDTTIVELDLVTGPAAINSILDVAAQANWQHAHHKTPGSCKGMASASSRTFTEISTRCHMTWLA